MLYAIFLGIAFVLLFSGVVVGVWSIFEKSVYDKGSQNYQAYLDKVFRLKILSASMLVGSFLSAHEISVFPPDSFSVIAVVLPATVAGAFVARSAMANRIFSVSPKMLEIVASAALFLVILLVALKYMFSG